jgi:hypothetical protein
MKKLIVMVIIAMASIFGSNANAHTYSSEEIVPLAVVLEGAWDALNIVYDAGKIGWGYATGNPALVSNGCADLAFDIAALYVPGLPAGGTKLFGTATKEGVRQLGKEGAEKISKEACERLAGHAMKGHGKNGTGDGFKFLVDGVQNGLTILRAAKDRIAKGKATQIIDAANLVEKNPTKTIKYVIDMGAKVGSKTTRKGTSTTNYMILIINEGAEKRKGNLGTFYPISLTKAFKYISK